MNNNGETVFHSSNGGLTNTNTNQNTNVENNMKSIPNNYNPLSPWAYFGYSLLFSMPLVGFILLIVFSFNNDNINRRNFARSYWCSILIALIIIIIAIVLVLILGVNIRSIGNVTDYIKKY